MSGSYIVKDHEVWTFNDLHNNPIFMQCYFGAYPQTCDFN